MGPVKTKLISREGIKHDEEWGHGKPWGCGMIRSMRWSRYFNGWTTGWDPHLYGQWRGGYRTVNNAKYPKRDSGAWHYARGKL